MPDIDAEKGSLEPDSVSFMETLISPEREQVGLQNGFSPTSLDEQHSDAHRGGDAIITNAGEKEKTSTPTEQMCPVGLHKAVLLYPSNAQSI